MLSKFLKLNFADITVTAHAAPIFLQYLFSMYGYKKSRHQSAAIVPLKDLDIAKMMEKFGTAMGGVYVLEHVFLLLVYLSALVRF